MEYVRQKIRDVYDFPKPGIIFRDLTTMFKDARAMHIVGWDLAQLYRDKGVTKVVGIESRGFIEIHRDAITPDDVVVIHDDLLATGGTMAACYELVKSMNPKKVYINFIVELSDLHGRDNLPKDAEVTSLIVY